jgi:D-amino peptidase
MKILISADIEGIAGISTSKQVSIGGDSYETHRKNFTEEINMAVKAAFDSGAKEVYVTDGHGSGINLLGDQMDKRVKLIQGTHRKYFMMESVDKVDYCILIGYHGGSNTLSVMAHTNNSSLMPAVKINGNPAGEVGMNILLAKHFGVKTLFVSGTDGAIEEVERLNLGVETVITKNSLSTQSAILKHKDCVQKEIYDGVKKSINGRDKIAMISTKKVFSFEIRYPFAYQVQDLDAIPGIKYFRNVVTFSFSDYEKAYRLYRHINRFVYSLKPY